MDTIRTYLDNMFLNLPETSETLRAKEELYAMMEDKYTELKEAGKSEHEAIGTVIAEFGNLDEVIEELHLREQPYTDSDSAADGGFEHYQSFSAHIVSIEEAESFLYFSKQAANKVASGVMLCIFSPVLLIYLGGLWETTGGRFSENIAALIGLIALFGCIAAAVVLFINSGSHLSQYRYLKEETYWMSRDTVSYLEELKTQFHSSFTVQISIGVCLCILSVIPVIASGLLFSEFNWNYFQLAGVICVCLLFLFVGVGVFLLVRAGMISESYKMLLGGDLYIQDGEVPPPDSKIYETSAQRRKRSQKAISNAISDVYWMLVTAAYLIWSFTFHTWRTSWLIWPLAGIFWGALESVVKAIKASR